ncbi:hypothetical protein MGN70_009960 [Eutypa lata]|uniref:Uncharacterized protein n=1 Tax=Eutypa lata (strain UCR-EL1) TaxID=1287681 RepID=M7TLZ9_EUTLA|nr:hypothetical protein UCREL1_5234 [Eutypa lata UCREL1]KAI1248759.1 hypothetical protein MGN70_009960 [Eutypa lata]
MANSKSGQQDTTSSALVLDLLQQSISIKKDKDEIENSGSEYWVVNLPEFAQRDCWDLYMTHNESTVSAIDPTSKHSKDGFFVGRLNLQKLGSKGHRLRKRGKLNMVYIPKLEQC